MIQKQIDIVIPSFRLDENYLLPLIDLPKPPNWEINYYIVVDNPTVNVSASIRELAQQGAIHLFINEENLGASASRNKGIDAGRGEWILFLDDDIRADKDLLYAYAEAIEENPNEIGFIGLTDFPPANNAFTSALQIAHLTHFKIAMIKDRFTWGVTANMMYRRSAMGGLRFSSLFPKSGGGEDVDLPLRICLQHQKEFQCLKEATVIHPWWNDSTPHYDRFVRYGIGTAYLLFLHKKLTWYDFPNAVESLGLLFIFTPLFIFFLGWESWISILLAIPVIEYVVACLKVWSKGILSLTTPYYISLLKASFDLGVLKTVVKNSQLRFFMKRVNPTFSKPHHFHLNKWKIIKLCLYIGLFLGLTIG